jgi:hypothetical protein
LYARRRWLLLELKQFKNKGRPKMNVQKLKGGMIAGFAMTGLVASLGLGSGLAAVADMGSGTSRTPASTVTTAENCAWYMTGAPTNLALNPEDNNAKYDGSELDISTGTLDDISIYSSGNKGSQKSVTNCTFYTGTEAPKLTWSITPSNPKFIATYGEADTVDENFNFDFDLTFDLDEKGGKCDDVFTVTDFSLKAGSRSVVGIQIADVGDVNSPIESNGQSCSTSVKAKTTIPAISEVPASAGEDYTWTGPTVSITGSTYTD